MKQLYAIIDLLAEDLAGPPTVHASDASAVRFFSDVAIDTNTMINRHVDDYILVHLGTLDAALHLYPANEDHTYRIILTGTQWKNSQLPKETT